jgi:predicted deacylase
VIHRHKWEDNIKIYFKGKCFFGKGPMMGSFEHGNEPSGSIEARKLLTSLASNRLSRRTVLENE